MLKFLRALVQRGDQLDGLGLPFRKLTRLHIGQQWLDTVCGLYEFPTTAGALENDLQDCGALSRDVLLLDLLWNDEVPKVLGKGGLDVRLGGVEMPSFHDYYEL